MVAVKDSSLCAVIIPVYRNLTDRYEEMSFRQCLKILCGYPIYLVTHNQLDITSYEAIATEYGTQLHKVFFDASFFAGIEGYNSLMKRRAFYLRFSAY